MIAYVKFCKKNSKSLPFPYFNFSIFFFLSKDWRKTKRNPSKPKVVYLKKYRFHASKVEDSEHAIYDVCERVRCSLTESRPPAVRRPAHSQIKMYGFCRLFRAMLSNACRLENLRSQARSSNSPAAQQEVLMWHAPCTDRYYLSQHLRARESLRTGENDWQGLGQSASSVFAVEKDEREDTVQILVAQLATHVYKIKRRGCSPFYLLPHRFQHCYAQQTNLCLLPLCLCLRRRESSCSPLHVHTLAIAAQWRIVKKCRPRLELGVYFAVKPLAKYIVVHAFFRVIRHCGLNINDKIPEYKRWTVRNRGRPSTAKVNMSLHRKKVYLVSKIPKTGVFSTRTKRTATLLHCSFPSRERRFPEQRRRRSFNCPLQAVG